MTVQINITVASFVVCTRFRHATRNIQHNVMELGLISWIMLPLQNEDYFQVLPPTMARREPEQYKQAMSVTVQINITVASFIVCTRFRYATRALQHNVMELRLISWIMLPLQNEHYFQVLPPMIKGTSAIARSETSSHFSSTLEWLQIAHRAVKSHCRCPVEIEFLDRFCRLVMSCNDEFLNLLASLARNS